MARRMSTIVKLSCIGFGLFVAPIAGGAGCEIIVADEILTQSL